MSIDRMKIARHLKAEGFKPEVAGSVDFNCAVDAIAYAMESGLGLTTFGRCGVGKSMLSRIVARMMLKEGFKVFVMGDPKRGTELIHSCDWVNDAINNGALIDDIGAELADTNFGNPKELFGELLYTLQWHYEAYRGSGKGMIVANSNLNATDFAKRYGERNLSRLAGMTHFWTMKGPDKRNRSKTNEQGTFVNGVKIERESVDYAKLLVEGYSTATNQYSKVEAVADKNSK